MSGSSLFSSVALYYLLPEPVTNSAKLSWIEPRVERSPVWGTVRSRCAALPSKAALCPVWHPLAATAGRAVWCISCPLSSGCTAHSTASPVVCAAASDTGVALVVNNTKVVNWEPKDQKSSEILCTLRIYDVCHRWEVCEFREWKEFHLLGSVSPLHLRVSILVDTWLDRSSRLKKDCTNFTLQVQLIDIVHYCSACENLTIKAFVTL